jgi:hypothetical protein
MAVLTTGQLFASVDYLSSERMLKENKAFMEFIDISITNLGIGDADTFRKAYEMHFNADLAYVQGDYGQTYKKVYASQRELATICHTILKEKYLNDSKTTLALISGGVQKSKNIRARAYLTLGYRDRAAAQDAFTIGDGSYRKFFSYKIFKYEEAISLVRKAQIFGYKALLESLTPESRIAIYNELVKQEKAKGGLFYSRFLDKAGEEIEKEMLVTYDDALQRGTPKEDPPADGIDKDATNKNDKVFETRLAGRVRFKKEADVAKFIHRHDFELAERVLRVYIKDLNFKLFYTMFDFLAKNEDVNAPKLDYEKTKIHLIDSYCRFSKDSILNTFLGNAAIDADNQADGPESPDDNAGQPEQPAQEPPQPR